MEDNIELSCQRLWKRYHFYFMFINVFFDQQAGQNGYAKSLGNGVQELQILNREEVLAMEPNITVGVYRLRRNRISGAYELSGNRQNGCRNSKG